MIMGGTPGSRCSDVVQHRRHQHDLVDPESRLFHFEPQLEDRQLIRHLLISLLVHQVGPRRLDPDHHMVLDPQLPAPAEVALSSLVHPEQAIRPPSRQAHDPKKRGENPVSQDDLVSLESIPELAEQRRLARLLSPVRPHRQVAH